MTRQSEQTLLATCEVRIDASPETVFEYFVDPEKMVRWMGMSADLDARPGGAFTIQVNPQAIGVGSYVEIDAPRQVTFTWGWEGSDLVVPGSSLVRVTLEPDGDATVVHLEHSGLPNAEQAEQHTGGWTHYLGRLVVAASGGDPGTDPWTTGTAR